MQFCSSDEFASKTMIKWPWKVQESAHQTALPRQEALSIPLLTGLTEQEQSKLVTLAERFLQQKRLVPLQGFELDSLSADSTSILPTGSGVRTGMAGWFS